MVLLKWLRRNPRRAALMGCCCIVAVTIGWWRGTSQVAQDSDCFDAVRVAATYVSHVAAGEVPRVDCEVVMDSGFRGVGWTTSSYELRLEVLEHGCWSTARATYNGNWKIPLVAENRNWLRWSLWEGEELPSGARLTLSVAVADLDSERCEVKAVTVDIP